MRYKPAYISVPLFPLPMGFLNDNNIVVPSDFVEGAILGFSSSDWEVFGCKKSVGIPSRISKRRGVIGEHSVGVLCGRVRWRVAVKVGAVLRGSSRKAGGSGMMAGGVRALLWRIPSSGGRLRVRVTSV